MKVEDMQIRDAIADLGKDADPPAGWDGRVMDAVLLREVVREAVVAECWPNDDAGSRARIADAIADRVASQLVIAAPVLSAEERDRARLMLFRAQSKVIEWQGWPTQKMYDEEVALLERILGVSR